MAVIPLTRGGPADTENFEFHWTGPYVQAHLLSDVGKKRSHNEDYCAMCAPVDRGILEQWGMLFAVADGMGGASAGELASRLALETTLDEYYTGFGESIPARLRDALAAANRAVFVESENDPTFHGMGTTVSVTALHGDCAYIAQVGDSRVYLKRVGEAVLQVTRDHSLVAEQVRNGFLSAEEAKSHSLKNLITRAVGIRDTVKVDLFALKIRENDTILICSDGLTNFVEDLHIDEAMQAESLQGVARMLVGHALKGGGSDNITAVLIRVTKQPPQKDLQTGAMEVLVERHGLLKKVASFLKTGKVAKP